VGHKTKHDIAEVYAQYQRVLRAISMFVSPLQGNRSSAYNSIAGECAGSTSIKATYGWRVVSFKRPRRPLADRAGGSASGWDVSLRVSRLTSR
jgi:hypothetical protein